jgi:hypothetical protein
MATFTGLAPELLEAREKDIFFKRYSMQETKYTQLFETRPSNKAYEDRMRVAGLGRLATKPEGTPVAFDDPVQGSRSRIVHQTYALGFRVTMEMQQDELFGIINQMPADLGDSARDHQERLAWDVINDGYDGNRHTVMADGVAAGPLFASNHTALKSGDVQSNLLSPAVALGVTGLESIMNTIATTLSEEGRYVDVSQAILLHHPNNQHRAYELLETEFKVDSSDNNRSTIAASRSGLRPLSVPYLTNTDGWSVHAPMGENSLKWNNRHSLEFRRGDDSDTFDQKFYAFYRASVQVDEWRGNYGSNF